MTEVALDASYGITPWLAAEARLGMRIADVNPTYTELDGSPKEVPDDIHHHDETLVGPTDPWLVLRLAGKMGDLVTAARLGVTLPLGRTEENPYELGAQGKSHEHLQFGTGTVVPVVGLGLSYAIDPLDLSLFALGQFNVAENAKGYQAPSRHALSLRVTVPLDDGAWRPYLTGGLSHQSEEYWDGSPGLEGATERAEILVGGGLSWRFAPPWAADIGLSVRVADLTDAASFDTPGTLQLGLSTAFDVGP